MKTKTKQRSKKLIDAAEYIIGMRHCRRGIAPLILNGAYLSGYGRQYEIEAIMGAMS